MNDSETCTSCQGTGYDAIREAQCHCALGWQPVKIDQTVLGIGNPRGNCLQACLATVLSLTLDETIDVTAPEVDPDAWHIVLYEWGLERGYYIRSQREQPVGYCIAIGPTVRKNGLHAVVFADGETYHDPHPSRDGLTRVRYFLNIKAIRKELGHE